MTRQELDEHIVDYLYDELSPAEAHRFEEGLVDHPDLQAEVVAHQRTSALFRGLEPEVMPPGLLDGVMREARVSAGPSEADRPGWLAWLLELMMQPAMATAMLFFIVAGTGWFLVRGGSMDKAVHSAGKVSAAAPMEAEDEAAVERPAAVAVLTAPPEGLVHEVGNGARAQLLEVEATGTPPSGLEVAAADPTSALAASAAKAEPAEAPPQGDAAGADESRLALADDVNARKARPKAAGKAAQAGDDKAGEQVADGRLLQQLEGYSGSAYGGQAADSEAEPPSSAGPDTGAVDVASGQSRAESNEVPRAPQVARGYQEEQRVAAKRVAPKVSGGSSRPGAAAPVSPAKVASAKPAPAPPPVEESPAAKAGKLLKQYDAYVKKGDVAGARRTLDELAKVPGYASQAKRRRVALEAEQPNRADEAAGAGDKAAAPAEAAPQKAAPAKKGGAAY